MGVGVSSLRLRKALILRSYNLRNEDQTMEEQFAHLGEQGEDGEYYISLDGVKDYLGFGESSQVEGTYRRLLGGSLLGRKVLYTEFIEFLETGRDPASASATESSVSSSASGATSPSRTSSKIRILKGFPGAHNNKGDLPVPGRAAAKSFPPGSPNDVNADAAVQSSGLLREKHEKALKLAQTLASADYTDADGEPANTDSEGNDCSSRDKGGANKQSEGTPEPKGSNEEEEAADDISEYDGPEPIIEENDDDEDGSSNSHVPLAESREVMVHENNRGQMVSNNVWRKREVVKQEREVFYTTVDADGQLQELVERETSQTEVLHMESRDTGEFAHRETTVYQQKETFNNEVVSEQGGQEEYLHLKSNADEYEHVESSMPAGRGRGSAGEAGGQNDGSSSPRVDGSGGASGGAEGINADFAAAADAQGGVGSIDLSGVNPVELDDETRAYFLYVLKQQREEALHRMQAMKQQVELCDQYRAFEGLADEDLDEETREIKEYIEKNIATIGRYLGEEVGVGIRNAMEMIEREMMEERVRAATEAEAGDARKEASGETMDDEGEGDDGQEKTEAEPYEEPDSPLPDSWFKDAKDSCAPSPTPVPVPVTDPNEIDDDEEVAVAAAAAEVEVKVAQEVEGDEEADEERATPASLHDID